eukprot:jgi/Botrbrau1/15966/Bobra.0294s0004.1
MADQSPRLIYVAVDDSPHSKRALQWAIRNTSVVQGPDELHFIAVLPPPPMPVAPSAPMATAGILAAQSVEAARKRDEHEALQTLARARELATKMGVPDARVHGHFLARGGWAPSNGRCCLGWDLAVWGITACTTCIRPVAIVRKQEHEPEELLSVPEEKRKVCVALDDSQTAQQGLAWTLAHFVQPQDELHLIAVAQAVPFPVPLCL